MAKLILPGQSLLRSPNNWVALGDSRVDQIYLDTPNQNRSASNHFNWGNALSGHRVNLLGEFGKSGDRTDQMLVRLPQCLATAAGVLYIHAGVNDIAQNFPTAGSSAATAFANIKFAALSAINIGMRVVIVLDPGATGLSVAQIAQLLELNERLREFAASVTGFVILFDLGAYIWNPLSSATAIGFKAGYMQDTTHEASPAAYVAGKAFATLIQSICPPLPREMRNIVESNANAPWKLAPNPLFSVGSGGTLGAGASGTVVSGLTAVRSAGGGTQTVVASVGASADGYGNEQIMACTFGGAGDTIRAQVTNFSNTLWNAGDVIQASCEVSVDAGTNLAGVFLFLTASFDASSNTTMDMAPISNVQATTEGYTVSLRTVAMTIPALTTKNFLQCYVSGQASNAGSATYRVRRLDVFKRFS
jgi:lysophospholipase L1-like esterase